MNSFRQLRRYCGLFCAILVTAFAAVGCGGTDPDDGFTGTTLDYELAATTVTVDEDTSSGVVSVDDNGSIVVRAGSTVGSQVSEGTVLLFQASDLTPNGLLRRVTSVDTDGNNLVLTTEPATLVDAFDEFYLVMNEAVESTSSALQVRSAIPGVTHKRIGGSGSVTYTDEFDFDKVILYDDDGNKNTTNDQVVLDGSISFSLGIKMEVDIGWGKLKKFAYTPVIKQKAEVEVSTTLAKWSKEKEIVVTTFSVPFAIVVVPMVFNVDIVIGAEGKLEARVSTGMTLEANVESGVLYKDGEWSLTGDTNVDFDYVPPTLDASASLKGYAGLRGELLICGVIGPELTVDGYLKLSADINKDPWWELVAGLEGFIGIKGEILGVVLFEYESGDFIKQKVTLVDAEGPFSPAACVPDCTGLECGPDPVCGQSCGTCDDGFVCGTNGECIATSIPNLQNGGFEQQFDSWNNGISPSGSVYGSFSLGDDAHEGLHSVELTESELMYQLVPLSDVSDGTLVLRLWIKGECGSMGSKYVTATLRERNADGESLAYCDVNCTGLQSDWTEFTCDMILVQGGTDLTVQVTTANGPGGPGPNGVLDDISIEHISAL